MKGVSFSLMGIVILLLIAGSVVEQICGTAAAVKYVYVAPWTITVWAATVVCAFAYIFTTKMWRQQLATFMLHFSFVVILAGAMTTHLLGRHGEVHLRIDEPAEQTGIKLPFEVRLNDFQIVYYAGTNAPMDFVSEVSVEGRNGIVSMNNIFTHKHYRFYQSQYDSDGKGVTLRVSYDPWGIGVTYAGYAMLLLSMLLFFFQRRTHFRAIRKSLATAVLLLLPIVAVASERTVSRQTAAEFGNLYVYYNNRVCPMQTLATDFTTKLYGKPSYKGLSAEQVLCGWLFYYDDWAKEPCIKIKGKETRKLLGIEGKYASLNDFVGGGRYKLDDALRRGDKNAVAADEKFRLVSMVCTAQMLKIYPVRNSSSKELKWYSWSDQLPPETSQADWQFVYRSMDYVFLCVARNAHSEAQSALQKIRHWQKTNAGADSMPSQSRFRAEKLYNSLSFVRPVAMSYTTLGIVLFVISCLLFVRGREWNKYVIYVLYSLMLLLFLLLTCSLILRWIASGHVPLSNGSETMQFLSWLCSLFALLMPLFSMSRTASTALTPAPVVFVTQQQGMVLSAAYLICGLTLMVSMMSAANPQITNLMPVLQSPLLTLHVAVIMIAYCLLAFVMLNGIMAIVLQCTQKKRVDVYAQGGRRLDGTVSDSLLAAVAEYERKQNQIYRLMAVSQLLLYPAVFCLTIGIFLGAVWANISWGRYWGWDPKEVWALITMLVYSLLLHSRSLKILQKPILFHIYAVVAFLFVLFTYFGVNFLLGGLHSYA